MSIARHVTDAELLAAVPDDVAAYEEFYRSCGRRVTAFAAKRCSCAEDVADVVAVTFVRLLGAARRYDPARGEPAAFVMGVAANVIRDQERRDARQQALVSKLSNRDRLDDDVDRIDAAIIAAQLTGDMRDALSAIPRRWAGDVAAPGQRSRAGAGGRPTQHLARCRSSSAHTCSAAPPATHQRRRRGDHAKNDHMQGEVPVPIGPLVDRARAGDPLYLPPPAPAAGEDAPHVVETLAGAVVHRADR